MKYLFPFAKLPRRQARAHNLEPAGPRETRACFSKTQNKEGSVKVPSNQTDH